MDGYVYHSGGRQGRRSIQGSELAGNRAIWRLIQRLDAANHLIAPDLRGLEFVAGLNWMAQEQDSGEKAIRYHDIGSLRKSKEIIGLGVILWSPGTRLSFRGRK